MSEAKKARGVMAFKRCPKCGTVMTESYIVTTPSFFCVKCCRNYTESELMIINGQIRIIITTDTKPEGKGE